MSSGLARLSWPGTTNESERKLVVSFVGSPAYASLVWSRTTWSSLPNVSPVTGALIAADVAPNEAVSMVRFTPMSAIDEAYIVRATRVVVARRMEPRAANSRSGSLNALLTIKGPRMCPPSPV